MILKVKFNFKKYINSKELLIYIALTIIFFGVFYNIEYAVDTYATFSFSIQDLYNQFAPCGRFIIVLFGTILKFLNINNKISYFVSFAVGIICMTISQYKLYKIIEKDVKCKALKVIVPTLIILNIFSIELFLFIEKGIMIFSILMCICALEVLIIFFETKKKKYIFYAIIYMLLANFSYQGVTGIFVALSIIYILKYSKSIKEFVLNNFVVACIYGIPALIDYVLIKFFSVGSRVSGEIILSQSIKRILKSTLDMIIYTHKLLPKCLYLGLVGIITILLVYNILVKDGEKIRGILKIIYIFAGIIIVTVFPQIMQSTDWIWFVPRSTYSYAALYGILILYLNMNYDFKDNIAKMLIILSGILLVFQFHSFNRISTDRYKVNVMDYEITRKICESIDKYEENTENKVEKIAIYSDSEIEYSYKGIFVTGDINVKAYAKEWGILSIIDYYYNRELIQVQIDSQKQKEFNKKNWTSFCEEQLVFEGDTLHLCMY